MRKFFIAALIIVASLSLASAQSQQGTVPDADQIPNMGQAPKQENGIGRLDLRVVGEDGKPVEGAFAKLESSRSDGYFCESWDSTNNKGVAVLPPIHMGKLKLIVKAKGYQTLKIEVPTDSLAEPVRVTLHKK